MIKIEKTAKKYENMLLNGDHFKNEDLEKIQDYLGAIDIVEGSMSRWSITTTFIFEVEGRLFALDYERGLTEMQEDIYLNQPYEVEKYTEIVEEVRYKKLNKD